MSVRGTTKTGRVDVEVELANYADVILAEEGVVAREKVRHAKVPGIVDTGAARLVLHKAIADRLGFADDGEANVRYADDRVAKRRIVKNVRLELCGRHGFSPLL